MDIILDRVIELLGMKHGATKELADALGVSGGAITNWKNGHSKSYTKYLPQIAAYYGVSLDWLAGLSDIKNPPAVSDEEEASLKRLIAWNLEDVTMLDPSNRARKKIYEKLLESERQK